MPTQNNVIALPGNELGGLDIAATSGQGSRMDGSRNEIWLCPGFSNGMGVMLYIKPMLSQRAMFAEALAAQLGHCLKLPCPTPYLVTVNPMHIGRPRGKPVLAFGSEQVSERALARPIRNLDVMLALLDKLKLSEAVSAFDEWIANSVRSPSDVLFDPSGSAWLIDHEGAMEAHLSPSAPVTNWLAMRLTERLSPHERPALLKALRAKVAAAHRAHLASVPAAVQYAQDGVAIYRALVDFLLQRLHHLDHLLSKRVMPDQSYLLDQPANDHDAHGSAHV